MIEQFFGVMPPVATAWFAVLIAIALRRRPV
jgi:hypothetical protein